MANYREGSILSRLAKMCVEDEISFPIANIPSVRAAASLTGARFGRIYSTHMDRVAGIITVTRKS